MLSILKPHRSYGYQEFTGLNPIKYIVLSWLRLRYSIGLIRKDFPGDGQDFPLTLSVDTLLRWQMGHRAAFASAPQGDFNGSDLHWNAWSLSDTKFSDLGSSWDMNGRFSGTWRRLCRWRKETSQPTLGAVVVQSLFLNVSAKNYKTINPCLFSSPLSTSRLIRSTSTGSSNPKSPSFPWEFHDAEVYRTVLVGMCLSLKQKQRVLIRAT